MRDSFVKTIKEILTLNSETYLLTGDLGFGIFDSFDELFEGRYLNVGVAEQNMIGIATGLGLINKSVFCYSIANFVFMRNLEQVRNGPVYHDCNVTLVCSGGGFTYGQLGFSHFAIEDYGILSTFSKINILLPSTAYQVELATKFCNSSMCVNYLRLEKKEFFFDTCPLISNETKSKELGLQRYALGQEIAILAIGGLLEVAMKYYEMSNNKKNCSIYSITCLSDLDDKNFINEICNYKKLYILEEHVKNNSVGQKVKSLRLDIEIIHLCIDDGGPNIVGDQDYLRNLYGLTVKNLLKTIK